MSSDLATAKFIHKRRIKMALEFSADASQLEVLVAAAKLHPDATFRGDDDFRDAIHYIVSRLLEQDSPIGEDLFGEAARDALYDIFDGQTTGLSEAFDEPIDDTEALQ